MGAHQDDHLGSEQSAVNVEWVAYTRTVAVAWAYVTKPNGDTTKQMLGLHVYGEVSSSDLRRIPMQLIHTADPKAYPRWPVKFPQGKPYVTPLDAGAPPPYGDVLSKFDRRHRVGRLPIAPPPMSSRDTQGGETVEAFYQRVARSYEYLASLTGKPTTSIAMEAGVPKPTAARWVHEARKRGLLTATTRGRVTR